MTTSHVFFIPAVMLVGVLIGYVVGRKLLLQEQQEARAATLRRQLRQQAASAPAQAPQAPADSP